MEKTFREMRKSNKMENTSSRYDSIRELDEERGRSMGHKVEEMSIEDYMKPPPFWELGGSISDEEEVRYEPYCPLRLANKSNRIRVKNIRSDVSIEFTAMVNAARFLGATRANVSYGILDKVARVYRVGEERFVFEYDGVERPMLVGHVIEEEKRWKDNQFAKRYVTGKNYYTIEFNGEERDKDNSNGIVCHWKGIYDGNYEGICGIKVTYGNPKNNSY